MCARYYFRDKDHNNEIKIVILEDGCTRERNKTRRSLGMPKGADLYFFFFEKGTDSVNCL